MFTTDSIIGKNLLSLNNPLAWITVFIFVKIMFDTIIAAKEQLDK